jgi:hypothetical protein
MPSGINRVLFTTPQFLKDNTVVNDNVEDNILRKCISISEDKYIQPLLGTQLYLSLTTYVKANVLSGSTIPANYKLLLDDYIVPTLLEYSTYELVPFSFKFRNKGISRQTSPDSIPAEVSDLIYVRNNVLANAQFYADRLTQYLITQNNLYPEYYTNQMGDIKPARTGYSSGIFYPGRSRGLGCDGCGIQGLGYGINGINITL